MATIMQIANADRNLSSFSRALKMSGLENELNEIGPFTILGPVNLAFERMAPNFEQLLSPENRPKLIDLLSNYVLQGKKMLSDFRDGRKLATINGKEVAVVIKNGEIRVNGARILAKDRQGKNGVIHTLDSVYTLPE